MDLRTTELIRIHAENRTELTVRGSLLSPLKKIGPIRPSVGPCFLFLKFGLIRRSVDPCFPDLKLDQIDHWKESSWKESSEVGENRAKLERTDRSWKASFEVGKLLLKLESFAEVGKFYRSWKDLAEVGKFWLKLESSD